MAPALVTAAWKSPPRRSAPSVALREFRLQGLDWLQDEGVDATQRGEIQAHVVSEEQVPEHAAHDGGSLVGDLLDLRLAGHEPHRDVELTTDVRRLIAVPQEDCSMGAGARVFHPADEFVVIRFGERGGKREDLRVLVQLGLPSPSDRDEGRSRVRRACRCAMASLSSLSRAPKAQPPPIPARMPKRWPNAPRGGSPVGTANASSLLPRARSRSVPPDVIATTRQPNLIPCAVAARVSSVLPEYDTATRRSSGRA